MRFVRVHEPEPPPPPGSTAAEVVAGATWATPGSVRDLLPPTVPPEIATTVELEATHILLGEGTTGENLPQIAHDYYHDPDLWWLHVEKTEVHTPDSLHERNQALYRFAEEHGLDGYDGMDVGAID